jgi:sugar fermentation stimulation protein A
MKLPEPLFPGVLVRRYQRFLAEVRLDNGTLVTAHTPNTGSMKECAVPGNRVLVSRSANPTRKIPYTLELIRVNGHWVDTHTHRTNRVVEEGLMNGTIAELSGYTIFPEFRYSESRIDFLLTKGNEKGLLEVKNVTLTAGPGIACFPDAQTERGRRHLQELMKARLEGYRAVIFFLVQRGEAHSFRPADEIDAEYGRLLREVTRSGVEALAYRSIINTEENRIVERIPVLL